MSIEEHEHTYGEWEIDNSDSHNDRYPLWVAHCLVEGCEWRRVTSVDPTKLQTPFDRAMNKLAGFDR